MKKKSKMQFYCSMLFLALSISCTNEQEALINNDDTQMATINLNVSQFEKSPFDADTRAEVEASKVVSKLSLKIFSSDNQVVIDTAKVRQSTSDTEFGRFELKIPYGTYTMVIIGHNNSEEASIGSTSSVTFSSNTVSDTFYAYESITVNKDSQKSLDVVLKRAVARFRITPTDVFPDNIQDITIKLEGGGVSLNPSTGLAISKQVQEKTITATSAAGTTTFVNTYAFMSSTDEESFTITVTAHDTNGSIINERIFTNVKMQRNYSTNYTGSFFSDKEAWSITIDSDYAGTNEVTFD